MDIQSQQTSGVVMMECKQCRSAMEPDHNREYTCPHCRAMHDSKGHFRGYMDSEAVILECRLMGARI